MGNTNIHTIASTFNFGPNKLPYLIERFNREQREEYVVVLRANLKEACSHGILRLEANYKWGWLRAGFTTTDRTYFKMVEVDEFGAFTADDFKALEEECIRTFRGTND